MLVGRRGREMGICMITKIWDEIMYIGYVDHLQLELTYVSAFTWIFERCDFEGMPKSDLVGV